MKDVLLGDVFLCTGQSNMQLAVRAAGNAAFEMRAATDGQIRQLGIATKDSLAPLATFATPVSWAVGSPDTVGIFSASCYYFARELKQTTKAPVGLVVAAWGGSRVRDWVSEPNLLGSASIMTISTCSPSTAPTHRRRSARWDASWEHGGRRTAPRRRRAIRGSRPTPSPTGRPRPPRSAPGRYGAAARPTEFVGQMWMRTSVDLTAAQAAQPASLDLGAVNEEDQSWVNGKSVGGTSWSKQALHEIPAGVLHAGTNTIVTNIFCSWRNCGMSGPVRDTRDPPEGRQRRPVVQSVALCRGAERPDRAAASLGPDPRRHPTL